MQKLTDRNDPVYVVDKPKLRYVPEVLLECFRTYAVDFNTPRWPVYVIHRSYFVDESVAFRHGMDGIYYIENKAMVVDVVIPVDRGDFPLSSLDQSMSEGVIDPAVFGRASSFLDDQHDLYQFRHLLAFHFSESLSGGSNKRSFRFELACKAAHFFEIVKQKQNPHVEISTPKFRGHSGGSVLTHDTIFKIISPTTEACIEFESVDLLFNFLGSFFYFWPLTT